jgi:septal ring factor EnvC (AmiA/AmiB activator)
MEKLLNLLFSKLVFQYRRYKALRMIVEIERDLELTNREIAEKQAARRELQHALMELKLEHRDLQAAHG